MNTAAPMQKAERWVAHAQRRRGYSLTCSRMDARTGNSKTTHGLGERKRTGDGPGSSAGCLRSARDARQATTR
jgi:hypothetical protein